MNTVTVQLTLTHEQAAALARFVDKMDWEKASSVLYPHVRATVRSEQSHTILNACATVQRTLADAGVSTWPWIETGRIR